MTSKKDRITAPTPGEVPGTDDDDIYLPVCCGEFGCRQAAGFRELWEATWSQDRRGKREPSEKIMPAERTDHAPEGEEDSSEG